MPCAPNKMLFPLRSSASSAVVLHTGKTTAEDAGERRGVEHSEPSPSLATYPLR